MLVVVWFNVPSLVVVWFNIPSLLLFGLTSPLLLLFQFNGFQVEYLQKVPEVKDTVHKQSMLHHLCTWVVEQIPESSDLYSEIGPVARCAKVRNMSTFYMTYTQR